MNCILVMKIKWSLDINTGVVEKSEAARACRLAGATVVGDDVIASTGYMKKQPENCPLTIFRQADKNVCDRPPQAL